MRQQHPPPVIRWGRAHPRQVDALLAGVIAVVGVVSHLVHHSEHGEAAADPSIAGVVLSLLASVPIAWRRVRPLEVLAVVIVSQWALEAMNANGPGWIGVLIAAYSVGAYHTGKRIWWVAAACGGAVAAFVISAAAFGRTPWAAVGSTLVIIPAVVVFGDSKRLRRKRMAELAERAENAERERELLARQHIQDERTRIARELHDVVAHSVSVMVIQAGAARRQLETNPERANTALETIETTGRAAMIEMRRILGVLRDHDDSASLAPTPSLALLPDLVGVDPDLHVVLEMDGDLSDISTGVEVNVYRLVQEALTNVRRHAGVVHEVAVYVTRTEDRLDVDVVDDGRGASTLADERTDGSGHGLIGMRERVASTGGEFSAGPRAGGGWRVHAVFPVTDGVCERAAPLVELPAVAVTMTASTT